MIDPKVLRADPDRRRRAQQARGEPADLIDQLLAADEARRAAIGGHETLRAEQKDVSGQIPKASGEQRQQLLART